MFSYTETVPGRGCTIGNLPRSSQYPAGNPDLVVEFTPALLNILPDPFQTIRVDPIAKFLVWHHASEFNTKFKDKGWRLEVNPLMLVGSCLKPQTSNLRPQSSLHFFPHSTNDPFNPIAGIFHHRLLVHQSLDHFRFIWDFSDDFRTILFAIGSNSVCVF